MRDWLSRHAGTTTYGTCTTLLAAFTGLLGSVYAAEIGSSFPLHFGPYTAFSFHALTFWVSLCLFAVLFFWRQRHDDGARDQLSRSTREIQALVATLPPKAFRSQYARQSEAFWGALAGVMPRQVSSSVPASDLAKMIRLLLYAIAQLAYVYDEQPEAVYSANVMLFITPSGSGDPFEAAVQKALRFLPAGTDLRSLRGTLMLRSDLSVTTSSEDLACDEAVPVIALPIPHETRVNGRWRLLPGAPMALADSLVDGYADSHTLADWCDRYADLPPSVVESVRAYFDGGEGANIRSFISRRLGNADDPVGVLNLHSDRTGILGPQAERSQIFQAILTPLIIELEGALSELRRIERGIASPAPKA